MKIWFCLVTLFVWAAGASASVVYTAPPGPAAHLYPAPRLTVLPAQGQVPQQDYTALLITHGEGIITGGPLSYGPALSGIMDFSGPDQEQIMAFLESSDYLERSSMTMLARFTHAARPNLPRGVQFKRANMVDLFPQHLWVIQTQWMQSASFPMLQQAAVPEPCTALLFGTGGLLLLMRRRRQA
jgi:hypothetical protein